MIVLKWVEARNFMNIGNNVTRFPLDINSIVLIKGKNGLGKSIICDMICYGLFGKPFRKDMKLEDLVNDRNQKNMIVTIAFESGKDSYRIVRGRKPNILVVYKNDEEMKHHSSKKIDDEYIAKEILRLDYDVYVQNNIIHKEKFVSYMNLTAAKRREFLESVFNLEKFSIMKEKVKNAYSKLDKDLISKKALYDRIEQQIRHDQELEKQQKENIEDQINMVIKDIEGLTNKTDALKEEYRKISDQYNKEEKAKKEKEYVDIRSQIQLIDQKIYSDQNSINSWNRDIKKLSEKPDTCPTCGSKVDKTHIDNEILNLKKDIIKTQVQIDNHEETKKTLSLTFKTLFDDLSFFKGLEDNLSRILRDIEIFNEQIKRYHDNIQKLKEKKTIIISYSDLEEELKNVSDQIEVMTIKMDYYKYMKDDFLSDTGFKRFIMLRYKDKLEQIINRSLSDYGLIWKLRFKDNFDIDVIDLQGNEYNFGKFSSGQKQRFDLSIWFGFNEMMKLKTNSDTNLLVFDEVLDGSLDVDGQDAFVDCMKKLVDKSGKTCFIISHAMTGFDHEINVSAKNGFSHYERNF